MKNKFFLVFFISLVTVQFLSGQFYLTGQPPASIKWRQINTGNFRLIYPESFSPQAFRLAGILEEARDLSGHTLNHRPVKIPVIVHNLNSRANGLVVWAPRRMELYTTPPHSSVGGDWLKHLAVHEQRHVAQISKVNSGMTRFFSHIFGEQAPGAALGHLPLWFMEGDAVLTETTLTSTGRGRAPSFEMPLRTMLLNDQAFYSYDKYLFGSYKDYVPDHYQYGYQMVSSLRNEHGPELWENTLGFVGKWPVLPGAFSLSIRQHTGEGLSALHKIVLQRLRGEWEMALKENPVADKTISLNNRTEKLYHSYRFPVWAGDSAIIALKSGIGQINEFVKVSIDGDEESIFFPGILSSPSISFSGGRIAWSEFQPDRRWSLRQYSVIKIYDIQRNTQRRITSNSRYFAPRFAPDGLFLAVVEVDMQNRNFIVLVNSVTGEASARYPGADGKNLQQPAFQNDGKEIVVTTVCKDGTGIMALNLESGEWKDLVAPAFINISGVFGCNQMVCFHSDISGIDNLYAINTDEGTLYQVTGSKSGAFDGDLSNSGDRLVWSDYGANGFDIAVSGFDNAGLQEYDGADFFRNELIETLVSHEKGILKNDIEIPDQWESRPFRKGLNLFRFHSWSPFYYDYREFNIHEQPVHPGITLLSQNLLGTSNTVLGYSYREGKHVIHGNFIYRGWYPVFEAGFDYGDEPLVFMGRDSIGPENTPSSSQLNFNGSVYVPLNFSAGRHIAGMEPMLRITYNNSLYHYDAENTYKKGMATIQSRLLAYRYLRQSQRDLAPKWGQVFRWQRRSAPFESENLGVINAFEYTLYLPGLFSHHSLRFDAALQVQEPVKYYFGGLIRFPRGYSSETSERLQVLKSTYSFPVMYPDIAIPGILYVKRLHAGVFADTGINRTRSINQENNRIEWHDERLFSWGGSVTANFHLFRFLVPLYMSSGVAHIPGRDQFSFLFSFGMNLGIF